MEKGYEDIYSDTPYLTEELCEEGGKCWYIDIVYVPPHLRGQGHGKRLFKEFLAEIDPGIERVRLKSCALGSGHTKPFWESLGFKQAYYGNTDGDWGDLSEIMVLGVNGHKTPKAEKLTSRNNDRELYEQQADLDFLSKSNNSEFSY